MRVATSTKPNNTYSTIVCYLQTGLQINYYGSQGKNHKTLFGT